MKKRIISLLLLSSIFPALVNSAPTLSPEAARFASSHPLAEETLAKQLGWTESNQNQCGGYYLEPAFTYLSNDTSSLAITGNQGVFSLRGSSTLEGKVSISRRGQQITSQSGVLYRD